MRRDTITAAEYRELVGRPRKAKRAVKSLPRIEARIVAGDCFVEIEVPIRIESEMNRRDHRMARTRRTKEHRKAVHFLLVGCKAQLAKIAKSDRVAVTLTRIGPKTLDDDNLRSGLKGSRDEVAAMLGIDDASERYVWDYQQEPARWYGARIRIEARER